ncbi:sugar transferase [Hyphomonas sp.]|jgi:lipopolysaccharide/colanic/teichoic acid biosynthesis glycosyltransferase|uniref:sugar transferase n=2 Tax=Hyphomonas sp. TaxID=87 RepID=UPI0030024447|tara:strand:+ start:259 stop:954 length:696 start_codon:yes stop_codon:yes gene_type:complete
MGLRLSKESREVEMATYASLRHSSDNSSAEQMAKRAFDVLVASCILVFTAPLILTIAIFIRLQDGGPAIFKQMRQGKNGTPFPCYKLRSMVPDAGERLQQLLATDPEARREWAETQKLSRDPRITSLGQFIRKSSIDELPQLLNVIRGDMSLVGPRPIVESEISKYGEHYKHYCAVRPGLTGLWQVRGRSDTSYETRVAMDVEYARTRTFLTDVKILLLTLPAVVNSKGAR